MTNTATVIPLNLITRSRGWVTGIEVTDESVQIDVCDCCHLAWYVDSLTYDAGADVFECPLQSVRE